MDYDTRNKIIQDLQAGGYIGGFSNVNLNISALNNVDDIDIYSDNDSGVSGNGIGYAVIYGGKMNDPLFSGDFNIGKNTSAKGGKSKTFLESTHGNNDNAMFGDDYLLGTYVKGGAAAAANGANKSDNKKTNNTASTLTYKIEYNGPKNKKGKAKPTITYLNGDKKITVVDAEKLDSAGYAKAKKAYDDAVAEWKKQV